MKKEEPKHHL